MDERALLGVLRESPDGKWRRCWALHRHRRRRVYCIGADVPVLEMIRLDESFPTTCSTRPVHVFTVIYTWAGGHRYVSEMEERVLLEVLREFPDGKPLSDAEPQARKENRVAPLKEGGQGTEVQPFSD